MQSFSVRQITANCMEVSSYTNILENVLQADNQVVLWEDGYVFSNKYVLFL